MKNLIVHQKLITLILASILFISGVQSPGYSQDLDISEIIELDTAPELSVDQIYDKTIRSLIWVVSENSQGSGVLIDSALRLAVTNHHVIGDDDEVAIYFPVRNRYGVLIDERSFYLDKSNLGVLTGIGYAVKGRVIAKDPKTDLAVIQLDGLPDTAREIEHNFNAPAHLYLERKDPVQIFGNPGGLKLWKWAAGFFQSVDRGMIKINAGIYKGNSGGPVLDDQGRLIGLATSSNERHTTWAVPAKYIKDLLNTLQPRRVFSISNNTTFTVHYSIKWSESGAWKGTTVKQNQIMTHWSSQKSNGYPKIRFDYIANDGKSTLRYYNLKTYVRRLGSGVKPSHAKDAREYHFGYNSRTKILDLYDSEKSD